jgi:hypothetical protein
MRVVSTPMTDGLAAVGGMSPEAAERPDAGDGWRIFA